MATKIPLGIVGIGMVGTPIARYFQERKGYERATDLFLYDIDQAKGYFDDVNGKAEVVFVSVPTPVSPDGSADISAVEAAFSMLTAPKIVVIKSTVPPGTTESFQKKYPRHKVLFNPENLTETQAWEDFIRPDSQIVGFTEESLDAASLVLSLLPKAPFMSPWGVNTYKRVAISATEAEIIKYARNVHFARKVNFANALARLAAKMGGDYENIRSGMSADHRIGDSHLNVNYGGYRGFGGYCLPKDLAAFIKTFEKLGLRETTDLLKSDWEFNKTILAEQGLTIEEVSRHDGELKKKLEERNKEKKNS